MFIVLDISILRLEAEGTANVHEIVRKMRSQRPLAIGLPSQYAYCHRTLIEYALDRKLLEFDIDLEALDANEKFDEELMVVMQRFIKNALSKLEIY